MVSLEVTDLFKGAFLLCKGGDLAEVRVRNNGRRIATFLITGPDLDRVDSDYRAGRALVNPVQFRESLNHLRDLMFEKFRCNEGRLKGAVKGASLLLALTINKGNKIPCHDHSEYNTKALGTML